ncbi:MAG: hypothetical protein J6B00_01240 [Alphaproteobacteria bacterium]|nr:hypothetical protein [Alphaproteobacteria bacterium]
MKLKDFFDTKVCVVLFLLILSQILLVLAVFGVFDGFKPSKSVETTLVGDFVSFTEQAENGDTLTGVKNIKTGAIIVAPQMIDSIQVMKKAFAVYVNDGKGSIFAYRLDGSPLDENDNTFLVFEEKFLHNAKEPIYIGYQERGKTFYFPKTDEVVLGTEYYLGSKHIFIQEDIADGHCWSLRTTNGKQTWRFISWEIFLIKDMSSEAETFCIGLPNEDKEVVLYDVNGTELKTVSASRWNKAKSLMRGNKKIGTAEYLECKNIAKI